MAREAQRRHAAQQASGCFGVSARQVLASASDLQREPSGDALGAWVCRASRQEPMLDAREDVEIIDDARAGCGFGKGTGLASAGCKRTTTSRA